MEIKSFVGEKSEVRSLEITEKTLVEFARSLEINEEPSAAAKPGKVLANQASLDQSTRALPTFLTLLRDGEFELISKMGIQLQQVLHGEQEYIWDAPVRVGDVLQYESRVGQIHEKKGATGKSMQFISIETSFQIAKPVAKKIGTSKTTIIVRE